MKVLKIFLLTFVVLILLAVVGVWIFLKTMDTSKIKAIAIEAIEESLDRKATIDELSFSLDILKGVVVKVGGITLMDDPAFSSDYFLKVKAADVALDSSEYLKTRKIVVTSINIIQPQAHIIRLPDGRLNIPQPKEEKTVAGLIGAKFLVAINPIAVKEAYAQVGLAKPDNALLKDLVVHLLTIKDGQVIFEDKLLNPAMTIPVQDLDVTVKDLNFNSAFPVEAQCAIFSDQQNIKLTSNVEVSSDFKRITLKDTQLNTDLAQLNVPKVVSSIPAAAPAGLEKLEGALDVTATRVEVVNNALAKLSAQGKLTNGQIILKTLPYPVENINLRFDMDEKNIRIPEILMSIAKGKVTGQATINNYMSAPGLEGSVDAQGLQLADLVEKFNLPVKPQGALNGKFEAKTDSIDPKLLAQSLAGTGSVNIKEGVIKDINLLNLVLSRISVFPGLMDKLEQTLPAQYKEKLDKKDTVIDQFDVGLDLSGGKINLKDVSVGADGFLIHAQGSMDLAQNLMLAVQFNIKEDLSKALVEAQENFSFLLDPQKRINIPLLPYQGPLAGLKLMPDLGAISKQAFENRGKDEIKKAIFKALDIPSDEPPAGEPSQSQQPAQPKEERPEKILINNVLDSIFKQE